MRFTYCLICSLWIFSTIAEAVDVDVVFDSQNDWSAEEKALADLAAKTVFTRIHKYNIAACAYRNIYRGASKDQVRDRWGRQIPVLNKSNRVEIKLSKKRMPDKQIGQGYVGTADIDWKNYTINNLEVFLNNMRFDQDAEKVAKGNRSESIVNRWVMAISHELAHNIGYNHGSAKNVSWEANYPGYFITELSYCVVSNGKYGSDLGNAKKRRELMKKYGKRKS